MCAAPKGVITDEGQYNKRSILNMLVKRMFITVFRFLDEAFVVLYQEGLTKQRGLVGTEGGMVELEQLSKGLCGDTRFALFRLGLGAVACV